MLLASLLLRASILLLASLLRIAGAPTVAIVPFVACFPTVAGVLLLLASLHSNWRPITAAGNSAVADVPAVFLSSPLLLELLLLLAFQLLLLPCCCWLTCCCLYKIFNTTRSLLVQCFSYISAYGTCFFTCAALFLTLVFSLKNGTNNYKKEDSFAWLSHLMSECRKNAGNANPFSAYHGH